MTDDGDLIGHAVNVAARVAASAHAGEILVTDCVRIGAAAVSCLVFDSAGMRLFDGIDEARVGELIVADRLCLEDDRTTLTVGERVHDHDHQRVPQPLASPPPRRLWCGPHR